MESVHSSTLIKTKCCVQIFLKLFKVSLRDNTKYKYSTLPKIKDDPLYFDKYGNII